MSPGIDLEPDRGPHQHEVLLGIDQLDGADELVARFCIHGFRFAMKNLREETAASEEHRKQDEERHCAQGAAHHQN